MRIVILGLSITSSWGNGHATTYRGLVKELAARGHDVLFLERDVPWYASNRDLPNPPWGRTELYSDLKELHDRFGPDIRNADAVMIGSFVVEGVDVGQWVLQTTQGLAVFYDIDTPVTVAKLERGDTEYLSQQLIPRYDLYLSFTGGAMLERLVNRYKARVVRVLYCSVDPQTYYPEEQHRQWDFGYLGTYSSDRQSRLDALLLEPARQSPNSRMIVAGPLYPRDIVWPENVERREHLAPDQHRQFYNSQRFTLNITREEMVRTGYSPSVRLFEAAACGTPIITDDWPGLASILDPGREILVARSASDVLGYLSDISEKERIEIAGRAQERVMSNHTAARRALQLEQYFEEFRRATPHPLAVA